MLGEEDGVQGFACAGGTGQEDDGESAGVVCCHCGSFGLVGGG